MNLDERVYRLLLLGYPKLFRQEFGSQLVELFQFRREEAQSRGGALWRFRFWRFVMRDFARSVFRLRGRAGDQHSGGGGELALIWRDFKHAGRRLRRSPGFAATATLILAAGIGGNVATFSIVNSLLFQPPPFSEPARLVEILQDSDGGEPNSTSYPAYIDIREHESLFSLVAARSTASGTLELDDALAPVFIEYATASYLDVLGLRPARGRWFAEPEDLLESGPVAVLSHRMWRNRFASDPDILGRELRINGARVTVVGVGPEAYSGGFGPAAGDVWLSISAMDDTGGSAGSLGRRQDHPFRVVGRLLPGIQFADAQVAMDRLATRLATDFPDINRGRRIHVLPLTTVGAEQQGGLIPGAVLIMGVVGLVLLIATLNLANLLLVRGTARRREMAVRLALGGSRARVVRALLSETLILTAIGAGLGFVLARLLLDYLGRTPLQFGVPLTLDVRMDGVVFGFAVLVSAFTVLFAGLLPALRSSGVSVTVALNDRVSGSIRRRAGVTGALVTAQLATSLVLLFTAGLFIQGLIRSQTADPGFDPDGLALVRVDLRQLQLSGDELRTTYADLEERIEALPEVVEATLSYQAPVGQMGTTTMLLGDDADGRRRPVEIPWNLVGADYFATLGVPLLHGRLFTEQDDPSEPARIIVSEAMARIHWGRTDIVGELAQSESNPDEPMEIVGVVGNVKIGSLDESARPAIYWSLGQRGSTALHVMVRARVDPDKVIGPVRQIVRQLDPRVTVLSAATMEAHLGESLARQRFTAFFLSAVGAFALLLATFGTYALVSFGVAQRTREVGLRMALGAERPSILRLFLNEVGRLVGLGIVVGAVISYGIGKVLSLSMVGPEGQLTVLAVCASGLLGAALIATLVPATKAARLDPMRTLRQE